MNTNTGFFGIVLGLFVSSLLVANQDDIFNNVDKTRRLASAEEHTRAIGLDGCSGTLIAPNIGISAAHCQQNGTLVSGVTMAKGGEDDGMIGETLEVGRASKYDYWIFEIKWDQGEVPKGMKVVPLIQTTPEQVKISDKEDLDEIYTLGFPGDVSEGRDLFISKGFGKAPFRETMTLNNISLINGNSGGPVMRSSDHMLVSIVSGGPHRLNQTGFKDNDPADPKHWNWGPALYLLYKDSQKLQEIFPEGHNKFDSDLGHFNQFNLNDLLAVLPR